MNYILPEWSYLELREGRTHYRIFGDARSSDTEVIVLIHGIASSADACFRYLAKSLENRGYAVLVYDLLGRGRSSHPRSDNYDPVVFVRQLRELLMTLFPEREKGFHVLGYSVGSVIASQFAVEAEDLVASLTLVGPVGCCNIVPHQPPEFIANFVTMKCTPILRAVQLAIIGKETRKEFQDSRNIKADFVVGNLNWQARNVDGFYRALNRTTAAFPFDEIRGIFLELSRKESFSTLVLLAENDCKTPFAENYSFFSSIGGSLQVVVARDIGHWFVLERDEDVAEIIDGFVSGKSLFELPAQFQRGAVDRSDEKSFTLLRESV